MTCLTLKGAVVYVQGASFKCPRYLCCDDVRGRLRSLVGRLLRHAGFNSHCIWANPVRELVKVFTDSGLIMSSRKDRSGLHDALVYNSVGYLAIGYSL